MWRIKNLNAELEVITELADSFSKNTSSGMQRIEPNEIIHYLAELKSFLKHNEENISELSKKYPDTANRIKKEITNLKGICVYQFMKNFSVYKNSEIRAKELSDLLPAIKQVEENFRKKVTEAQNYFGEFLEGTFHFGINVTEQFKPHTLTEILERSEKAQTDWTIYTINAGYPEPYFKERFNEILEKGIEKFVDSYLA